ncbi:hypothetical protein MMC25_006915 [Agyrium rufum]|nr:hypothetical protein [Agyrium rufum]
MSQEEEPQTIPKTEPSQEGSFSSVSTSPEPELGEHVAIEGTVQVQKRKGGRKPIYATSEERKQRNRQAQAAFRERRTEYIKQLETSLKHQEEALQSLQTSHRAAADECLMLRYKNSLLERILLEKGIDVQAELKQKTDIQLERDVPAVPAMPLQRPVMGQPQAPRKVNSLPAPRLLPAQKPNIPIAPMRSPVSHPTPPSRTSSSETARSPNVMFQGGIFPPSSGLQAQQPQQQQPAQLHHSAPPSSVPSRSTFTSPIQRSPMQQYPNLSPVQPTLQSTSGYPSHLNQTQSNQAHYQHPRSNPWPTPYQTHMEQLGKLTQQEYSEAQPDMLDVVDEHDPAEHTTHPLQEEPSIFEHHPSHHHHHHHQQRLLQQQQQQQQQQQHQQGFNYPPPPQMVPITSMSMSMPGRDVVSSTGVSTQPYDPFDPTLDADPFGLSASMHFPTQFQESSLRR